MYNAVPAQPNEEKINQILESQTPARRKVTLESLDYQFGEHFFPHVDCSELAVIYGAENSAPAYPANVLTNAFIYKNLLGIDTSELIARCTMDDRAVIALHLYDYYDGNKVFSEDTLERFELRIIDYEWHYGCDLLRVIIMRATEECRKEMGVSNLAFRLDSVLVESNIELLSRYKLLFKTVQKVVRVLNNFGLVPADGMEHYLRHNDWNLISYQDKTTPLEAKIDAVLKDAVFLVDWMGDETDEENCLTLKRVLHDQAIQEADGTWRMKKDKSEGLNSTTCQSPADPDASFRAKAGKKHTGNVGLAVEVGSGSDSLISYYSYANNTTSDEVLLEDFITNEQKLENGTFIQGPAADPENAEYIKEIHDAWRPEEPAQNEEPSREPECASPDSVKSDFEKEPKTVYDLVPAGKRLGIGDGGFSGAAAAEMAEKVGIEIHTTRQLGKKTSCFVSDFQLNEKENGLLACPHGEKPLDQSFNAGTKQIRAVFDGSRCKACPFYDQCHPKEQKRGTAVKLVSVNGIKRAAAKKKRDPKAETIEANYRNGVETIFSWMRRKANLDKMPVRRFYPTKFTYGCIVGAYNASKVCRKFSRDMKTHIKNCGIPNIWENCALLEQVIAR